MLKLLLFWFSKLLQLLTIFLQHGIKNDLKENTRINGQIFREYLPDENFVQLDRQYVAIVKNWKAAVTNRCDNGKMQITDIALSTFSNFTNRKSGSVFARSQLVVRSWIPVLKRENDEPKSVKLHVNVCAHYR